MNLTDALQFLVSHANPALGALLMAPSAIIKFLVDALRRLPGFKNLQGNVIQTLTFGVSIVVTIVESWIFGISLRDPRTLFLCVLVTTVNWMLAIGFHNAVTDTNPPPPTQGETGGPGSAG